MTEMLTGTACSDVTGRLYERLSAPIVAEW